VALIVGPCIGVPALIVIVTAIVIACFSYLRYIVKERHVVLNLASFSGHSHSQFWWLELSTFAVSLVPRLLEEMSLGTRLICCCEVQEKWLL